MTGVDHVDALWLAFAFVCLFGLVAAALPIAAARLRRLGGIKSNQGGMRWH